MSRMCKFFKLPLSQMHRLGGPSAQLRWQVACHEGLGCARMSGWLMSRCPGYGWPVMDLPPIQCALLMYPYVLGCLAFWSGAPDGACCLVSGIPSCLVTTWGVTH